MSNQDDLNPSYRSRPAAQRMPESPVLEPHVATSPFECFRVVIPGAMDLVAAQVGNKMPMEIVMCDVSRACFYAKAVRFVYVTVVHKDREPGHECRCGKLNVPMYGTRDAAMNWRTHRKHHLIQLECVQGEASPCIFYNLGGNMRTFIHGDDYVPSGREDALEWFVSNLKEKYECKVQLQAPDAKDESQVTIPDWILT